MKLAIVIVSIVGVCLAMTTTHKPHHPHVSKEPHEYESLVFLYNAKTHNMILKQRVGQMNSCYVAMLSDQERQAVHTDTGIRTLELKLLNMLSSATSATMADLNSADAHACGHAPHNGTMNYFTLS